MLNLSNMTLEEKIKLLSGKSGDAVANRYGKRYLRMSDGPHGVRSYGICYPNMCLASCSWDKALMMRLGESIANDCITEGVDVLLGPSVNLKRSVLCGRNFEYLSEDPVLAGTLAAAFIEGVQRKGIFACVKHYCCYNQEKNRFTQDVRVNEDTLMNLYVRVFRVILDRCKPAFLMTSYNKVNGEFVSQSRFLVTDILKKTLGFDGIVITDWGGVDFRQKAMAAGVDINMPGDDVSTAAEVMRSYLACGIQEDEIDRSVAKVICAIDQAELPKIAVPTDFELLRKVAAESMVLCKNSGALPLSLRTDEICIIGALAKTPRTQGGGCAEVVGDTMIASPYDTLGAAFGHDIDYAQGYLVDQERSDERLEQEAVKVASRGGKVLFFMGLQAHAESEGYDRTHIRLPQHQLKLLKKIHAVNKKVVVIVTNGSVVELSEVSAHADAVLECFYAGDVYADALTDVLTGAVNPSGKLAETFPLSFDDTVAATSYVDDRDAVTYAEGDVTGYMYLQRKNTMPLYPFGFGLSYTTFSYQSMRLSTPLTSGESVTVSVAVKNTGTRMGKEVVQVYLERQGDGCRRLAAYEKISLSPDEEQTVELTIGEECLTRYSTVSKAYMVQDGDYTISVCTDAETPVLSAPLRVEGKFRCTRYTKIDELRKVGNGPALIEKYFSKCLGMAIMGEPDYGLRFTGREIDDKPFFKNLAYSMPLYLFTTLTAGMIDNIEMDEIINQINRELVV